MATITGEEGAEMVNAALATCQNPRDFYGKNLIEMLRKRLDTIPSGSKTKYDGTTRRRDYIEIRNLMKLCFAQKRGAGCSSCFGVV